MFLMKIFQTLILSILFYNFTIYLLFQKNFALGLLVKKNKLHNCHHGNIKYSNIYIMDEPIDLNNKELYAEIQKENRLIKLRPNEDVRIFFCDEYYIKVTIMLRNTQNVDKMNLWGNHYMKREKM